MFLLRRAAARGLQTKSFAIPSTSRSFVSSSALITRTQPQLKQQWYQRRAYSGEVEKKTNESPAEEEGGETVTTEPEAKTQEKEIVEESVATPETVDAAQSSNAEPSGAEAMGMEPGDAAPEPETTPSKPEASPSATESASSTVDAAKDKLSDVAETVSNAASSAMGSARESRFAPRVQGEPSKILYIGNLFFDLTSERLEAAFSPFGNVVNCKIVTDTSGMSKGFGYIEYDSVESAARAIKELDQELLEGRRMAVQYHVRRVRENRNFREPAKPSKTLFIGNMSFQMTDKDLNDLFRQVKNVLDVRVAIDRRSGQPRGFAHADFTDTASAERAKQLLENKVVYGRQLRIDYGLPPSRESR